MMIRSFFTSLLSGILVSHLANAEPQPVKTSSSVIKSIDVEDLLTKSLKLDRARRVAEDAACPGGGGGGMRAKRWCYWNIEFRDLAISKVISVEIAGVEWSKIPVFYQYEHVGHKNCWNCIYPYEEDITYKSRQSVTVTLSEVLTNVKEFSNEIDANANLLGYVGVRENTKSGSAIRYELTRSSTKSLEEEFELRRHIKYDVPPMTASWASYSDEKRDVKVPITITGVITGRVVDHSSYGTDNELFNLKDRPESERTFTVHGFVQFLGSNRSLEVTTSEKPLSVNECQEGPPPAIKSE